MSRQSLAEPIPGRQRALCTICGHPRTYRRGYHPRNHVGEVPVSSEPGEPFWRLLGEMKCEGACDGTTVHALLRDHDPDDWRDHAERVNYGQAMRGAS